MAAQTIKNARAKTAENEAGLKNISEKPEKYRTKGGEAALRRQKKHGEKQKREKRENLGTAYDGVIGWWRGVA